MGRGHTPTGIVFLKGIVKGFCEDRQALRLYPFYCEGVGNTAVVFAHLGELSCDLAGQFDAVLDGGIRFERLSLDLLEKIGTCSQELVV